MALLDTGSMYSSPFLPSSVDRVGGVEAGLGLIAAGRSAVRSRGLWLVVVSNALLFSFLCSFLSFLSFSRSFQAMRCWTPRADWPVGGFAALGPFAVCFLYSALLEVGLSGI